MMMLTTHEARVIHAVLEFGPSARDLMSDTDSAHLARAKVKLTEVFIEASKQRSRS